MGNERQSTWHETDFEHWFDAHPFLPDGERILLVGRHQPIRRMVDLIGVDGGGGLVILEIKNETSDRRAIGQALEYLSHYEELTLDVLLDEDDDDVVEAFRACFRSVFDKEPPELTSRRRVFLVAPAHDSYSAVCTRYLSRHLSHGEITFHLLKAARAPDGFVLEEFDCPPFVRTSALGRDFAISARRRVFYVLEPGASPVVWSVGRLRESDSAIVFRATPSRRTVRGMKWHLMPIDPPEQVDLAQNGTVWAHRHRVDRSAKVVGRVRLAPRVGAGTDYVVFAAFRGEQFATFRKRPADEFLRDWQPSTKALPDWRGIAQLAQHQVDIRKARVKARKLEAKTRDTVA
jgi:hypothetical protein